MFSIMLSHAARLCALLMALCAPAQAAVLHVAPGGKAGADGSADAPLQSVQSALDRAQAGDTVRLAPGVYRERVAFKSSGKYLQPVTLEGEPGAILDGSENIALDWQLAPDIAPATYRAKIAFEPFTVTADAKIVTMLREDRVSPGKASAPAWEWRAIFQNGVGPSKWAGVKALALYLRKPRELIIRFQNDLDPRKLPMTVAPRDPIIHIKGFNRAVVRGLTLRNAAYGVLIEDSLGSVVEQCTVGPVDYGVWLDSGADRSTIRFNELFMAPYAGADPKGEGAWDNWQAHKRGGHYDRFGVQIHNTLGGHEVHDNWIHDTWDGIEDRGAAGQNRGLRIHHNLIQNVSDDGLEPNGAEEDCRWHSNIVNHSICAFRIKAPTAGPLYAYRNIFFNNGEDFRMYGEVELKPARVYAYHNTSTSAPAYSTNKVFGIGTPRYHFWNNLFWCSYWRKDLGQSVEPNWKADFNVLARRGQDARWDTGRALAQASKLDEHSLWTTSAGFSEASKLDVSLTADSSARGHGMDLSKWPEGALPGCEPGYFAGAAPDAGALAFGQPMPILPRKPSQLGATEAPPAGSWPGAQAEAEQEQQMAQEPVLENGGFELGLEGWGKADAAALAIKTEGAFEGAKYLQITSAKRVELGRAISGLIPGRAYVLTFGARRCSIADMRIIVRDMGNQKYLATSKVADAGQEWKAFTLRFVASAELAGLEISARSAGTCELDGFAVARAQQ